MSAVCAAAYPFSEPSQCRAAIRRPLIGDFIPLPCFCPCATTLKLKGQYPRESEAFEELRLVQPQRIPISFTKCIAVSEEGLKGLRATTGKGRQGEFLHRIQGSSAEQVTKCFHREHSTLLRAARVTKESRQFAVNRPTSKLALKEHHAQLPEAPVTVRGPKIPLKFPHKLRPAPIPRYRPQRPLPRLRPDDKLLTARQLADLVQTILSSDEATGVAKTLDQFSGNLNRRNLALLIRDLGTEGALGRALQVFSWMQQRVHLKPDERTYYSIIWTMAEAGQAEVAERLHANMMHIGCPRSAYTEKALALAYASAGRYREAVGVLRQMPGESRRTEASVCVTLIGLASKAGLPRLVRLLLQELSRSLQMKGKQAGPDSSSFEVKGTPEDLRSASPTDISHGLEEAGDLQGLLAVDTGVQDFRKDGRHNNIKCRVQDGAQVGAQKKLCGRVQEFIKEDAQQELSDRSQESIIVSSGVLGREDFSKLIASCSKVGLKSEAQGLIDLLKKEAMGALASMDGRDRGNESLLDVANWTAVITAYWKAGKLGEAALEFWRMQQAGVEPDLVSYRVMMQVYWEMDDAAKAADLVKQMRQVGRQPTLGDYNTLIALHCNEGNTKRAAEVLHDMRRAGVAPTADTHNHLIRAYKAAGQSAAAIAVAMPMVRVGGASAPNLETHCLMLEAYLEQRMLEKVEEELESLKGKGMCLSRAVADKLVAVYLEEGKERELRGALEGVTVSGGRSGLEFMRQRQNRMQSLHKTETEGAVANFNSLIRQFCNEGQPGKAQRVLLDMQSEGVSPSAETYNLLMEAYKDMGRSDVSIEIARLMGAVGELPSLETHCLLIELHLSRRDLAKVSEEIQVLRGKEYQIPRRVLDKIVRVYTEGGKQAELDVLLHGILISPH